jgi:hypothetical protein
MKMFKNLILVVMLGLMTGWLIACVGGVTPTNTPTAILGQPVPIKLGQSIQFDDGLLVTFDNVPTDGRCSSCTASFYAQVNLSLTIPGKAPVAIALKTPPLAQVQGDASPYRIEFVNLEPQRLYPTSSINRADYVVTVKVSK